MKKNMALADRLIRVGLAVIVAAIYFTNVISVGNDLLIILVGILILTSLVSFCPHYFSFGINSTKNTDIQIRDFAQK
jgi:hypothetical protein